MSTHNVLEALKQKIIREQGAQLQQPTRESPQRRESPSAQQYPMRDTRDSYGSRDGMNARDSRDWRLRDNERRGDYSTRDDRSAPPHREGEYRSRGDHRDGRAYRERDSRYERRDYRNGPRDHRRDGRDGRDGRNFRDSRDARDSRDTRDFRDTGRRYNGSDRYTPRDHDHRARDLHSDDSWREEDLQNVVPIDKLPRASLWDIKPKGFEKVSSERAKISGLFPLPGEARRVDISKLEGLVNGGDLNSHTSILFEQINIDAVSSRAARQLIITGVEFTLYPVERLVENIAAFVNSLEVEGAFIVEHELIDNKYLIFHLSNYLITTILYCSAALLQKEMNLKIKISRPQGYVTPDGNEKESDDVIADSLRKIAIVNVPTDITEAEIIDDLSEFVSPKVKVQIVTGTNGTSRGLVFVEFTDGISTDGAIEKISKIVIRDVTLQAIEACKGLPQPDKVTFRSIAKVANDRTTNVESPVIVILNAVHPEELKNDTVYDSFLNIILQQCSKYGKVDTIKLPKPEVDYKRNLQNLKTSVGKVFVKFDSTECAKKAAIDLNGRKFNERTVLVGFLPEYDFKLNLL